jgi:hypothetical protein
MLPLTGSLLMSRRLNCLANSAQSMVFYPATLPKNKMKHIQYGVSRHINNNLQYNSLIQLDMKNRDPPYLDDFQKLRYILDEAFKIDVAIFSINFNSIFNPLGQFGHP